MIFASWRPRPLILGGLLPGESRMGLALRSVFPEDIRAMAAALESFKGNYIGFLYRGVGS